jgi:cell division protein FtsI (penicillin-binding protein 3)
MRLPLKRDRLRPVAPADLPARPSLIRLEGAAKESVEAGRTRIVVAGALFALAFAILAGRLIDLTLLRSGGEPSLARVAGTAGVLRDIPLVDRHPLVDRNGVLLAANLRTASLYADPRRVLDPERAAAQLVRVLPELSRAELVAKLTSGKSFVWLRRNLTPRQQYDVNALGIPGLQFQGEQRRVYPQGALAAHVLGFTDIDNRGIAGIEQSFDDWLRDPARAGQKLELALDVRVQHALRDELQRAVARFNAIGAGGLVLDVQTGEVLALVSLPDFDPTAPGDAGADARFNRVTLGVYEMGSTMKTLTTAMALDAGTVRLDGGYDASAPIRISRFTIRDDHAKNRWLSVPEIFMYSSNIGAAKMALDVGPAGQREFLARLGMLRKPAIELPEIGAPLVPRNWKTVETMTIAFGHGLSVSPLQLASAVAAIVNGGMLHPATLIRQQPTQPIAGTRIVRPEVSDTMRRLLRLVVDEGTGKKAMVAGYLVGGKTGTSEKVNARGGYNRKALLNTFVAAFPMNAPRYVVLALLDEPKPTKETHGFATAGWTAAPTASRIIARIAPLLGVEPVDEQAAEIRQAMFVNINGRTERKLAAY